jgi:hypothetical protein
LSAASDSSGMGDGREKLKIEFSAYDFNLVGLNVVLFKRI